MSTASSRGRSRILSLLLSVAVGAVLFAAGWFFGRSPASPPRQEKAATEDAPPENSHPVTAAERIPSEPPVVRPAPVAPRVFDAGMVLPVVVQELTEEQKTAQRETAEATARDQISAAFERVRTDADQACWPDGVPTGNGPLVGLSYQIAIDASGNEVARGGATVTDENPDAQVVSPNVVSCLRDHGAPPVHMDPPGQPIHVTVFVSYP